MRKMRKPLSTAVLLIALLLPAYLNPEELLYPTGHNISCWYELSDSAFFAPDSLTITRGLLDNESFPISGLYFSENLPCEFQIISHSITLNGDTMMYSFQEGRV